MKLNRGGVVEERQAEEVGGETMKGDKNGSITQDTGGGNTGGGVTSLEPSGGNKWSLNRSYWRRRNWELHWSH